MTRAFRFGLFMGLYVAVIPPTAIAVESITVPRAVRYDPAIAVPEAIRKECELEFRIGDAVRDRLRKKYDRIASPPEVNPKESGLVLDMKIIDVVGRPGGLNTGAKSLTIQGTLWRDGTEIGDFVARRRAAFGSHTCKLLYRSVDRIAVDIADWINNPAKGSQLGDSR